MVGASRGAGGELSSRLVLLVFVLALVLRLWNLWEIRAHPMVDIPILDGWSYDHQAREILAGRFFGEGVFFQDPLYPTFLAGIYAVSSGSLWAVRVVQAVVGAGLAVVVLRIGVLLAGAACGLVSGLVAAAYPQLIYFDGQIMKESPGVFLAGAALWLLLEAARRRGWAWSLVAGVVFALAVMARGNLLLVAPFAALWLLWVWRRGGGGLRAGVVRAGLFLAGLALGIAPVTLHNVIAGGDFVLLTSQGGANFFIGNNPYADGASGRPPSLRKHPRFERGDFEYEAERALGRELKPSEVSRYWMDRAKSWIRENPGAAARLWLRKALLVLNVYEIPDNLDFYFYRRYSLPLRNQLGGWRLRLGGWELILGGWGLLLPLAVGGMLLGYRERAGVVLLAVYVLVFAASLVAFHVYDRYRLAMLPAVMPLAAYYVLRLAGRTASGVRGLAERRVQLSLAPVVLLMVLAQLDLGRYSFARSHYILGVGLTQRGDLEGAAREYYHALKIDPEYAEAWNNLGRLYFEAGQLDQARVCWEKALRFDPELAEAMNNLGSLAAAAGDYGAAAERFEAACGLRRDYFKAKFNLAQARVLLGQVEAGVAAWAESYFMDRRAFLEAPVLPHDMLEEAGRAMLADRIRARAAALGEPESAELAAVIRCILEGECP
jgi:4-amino-4-deoxy-L-arabinose transferase-like glycosyltransferase/thioredoxin-like negative regulator of GroEL